MTRGTSWLATAMAFGVIVALSAQPNRGFAQEKSAAANALEANPALRNLLNTSKFQELKQKLPHIEIDQTTYYFAEGDLRLDEDQLLFYAADRASQEQAYRDAKLPGMPSTAPSPGQLISHAVNGQIMRWTPGSTLNYCVLKQTFSGEMRYQMAVENMKAATDEWAATCNIKFKHDASKDDSAPGSTPPNGVTFTVREVVPDNPDVAPIASAFFPGDPRSDRHLLIFPDYFAADLIFDKVGVLRHELGHVIGFRHEHIRSEAPPVCQGEPLFGAIPQTDYDPVSVMHYFCGNRGSRELNISVLDRQGSRIVYGAPVNPNALNAPRGALDVNPEFINAFKSVEP